MNVPATGASTWAGSAVALAALTGLVVTPAACRLGGGGSQGFARASVLERLRVTYPEVSLPADDLPAGVRASEGLIYRRVNGQPLALDVYQPATAGLHPAVVVVHGGGWESGDRIMERPFAKRLATFGFVAASIDYRLRADGRFPAAFVDVRAAVRWLRAHAAALGIDGAHIGAVGGSAGGQLVALLGATNGTDRFDGESAGEVDGGDDGGDGGGDGGVGSRNGVDDRDAAAPVDHGVRLSADVQAVVALDGLADFTGADLLAKEARNPGGPTHFLGGSFATRGDVWRAASASFHVGARSAPTLFIDSTSRTPILPGRPEMCARLIAAGVVCVRVVTPGTPHPFWLVNPWFEPTVERTARFFNQIFGRGTSPAAL